MKKIKEISCFIFILFLASIASAEVIGEATFDKRKTVLKVVNKKNVVSTQNAFLKPKKGNKFAAVQVIIDNRNSTKDINISPISFNLKDKDGYVYSYSMTASIEPKLSNGTLDAGDILKGWLTFEVRSSVNINSMKIKYSGFMENSPWIPLGKEAATKTTLTSKSNARAAVINRNDIIIVESAKENVKTNSSFMGPKEGNKVIAIQVIHDNRKSAQPVTSTLMHYKLKDSEGNKFSAGFVSHVEPRFTGGTIESGSFINGWISFEVPAATKIENLRFRYEGIMAKSGWIQLSRLKQ